MVGYFKKAMSFVEFWRKCLIVKWFASTEAEPPLQDQRPLSLCVASAETCKEGGVGSIGRDLGNEKEFRGWRKGETVLGQKL